MGKQEPSTYRPFVFTVIEDDGVNVVIDVSEEHYQAPELKTETKKDLSI